MLDDEQVIEVPKLALEDRTPLRAVLREQRVAEQLVAVPSRDDRGIRWCHVLGRSGGAYWWMVGTKHTNRPRGVHCQPRAVYKFWARVTMVADVPVLMLHKFQQLYVVFILILVPQVQFIDRVLDIAVIPQMQERCELCRRQ